VRTKSRAYNLWRRNVKDSTKSCLFNPGWLPDDLLMVIFDFASSLQPVKSYIEFVKGEQNRDNVQEIHCRQRFWSSKDLRTCGRQWRHDKPERASEAVAGPPSKSFIHPKLCPIF